MKKVFRLLFSRVFLFSVLIVLQLGLITMLLVNLGASSFYCYLALHIISIIVVAWLITKDDNPSYKITWIILILTVPLLGGLAYLKFGNKTLPKRTWNKIKNHRGANESLFRINADHTDRLAAEFPEFATQAEYIRRMAAFAPCGNTRVEFLPSGEDFHARLLAELPKAEHFIFLEYFIIEEGKMWDPVLAILKERAAAGVEVCVLYDDFGCAQRLPASYPKTMEEHGIHCAAFNALRPSLDPGLNYRDHRKICVIDGKTGFCGGINLADEYINEVSPYGHWKDSAVLLRGEAVGSLVRMFLQLWVLVRPDALQHPHEYYMKAMPVKATGFVQPFSDTPLDHHNVAETVYMQIVNRARRYVYITTPYLVLDNEFVTCLKMAAESGVDVRIVMPSHPDKWYVHMVSRSYYQTLIRSGVKIYEYQPGFIHAKMFLCDDDCAVVGTANLDYRSLYLHYENAVVLYGCPAIGDVHRDILKILDESRLITAAELKTKLRGTAALTAFLKLLAPLM